MMLEGRVTPTNPAIVKSRELLKKYSDKRNAAVIPENTWNNFLYCQKCKMRGILTKYHKNDMMHVPFNYKKDGIIRVAYTHYCRECGETYTPQSERAGNKNE